MSFILYPYIRILKLNTNTYVKQHHQKSPCRFPQHV